MAYHFQQKLNDLQRIENLPEVLERVGAPRLLIPSGVNLTFHLETDTVSTSGLGGLDEKQKDLIEIANIHDPLSCSFELTNVFSPRTYVESLNPIPTHITVQAIILTKKDETSIDIINEISKSYRYAKTPYDRFWCENSTYALNDGPLILMNRRIGGWDGEPDRPVMELLGAGGHLPVVWNESKGAFASMKPEDCLRKEVAEEIGLIDFEIEEFGGFFNSHTSELVMLFGIIVPFSIVPELQASAFGNHAENTDGLYLGSLSHTIQRYLTDATPFAGGERAKPTNFPLQGQLMDRVWERARSI